MQEVDPSIITTFLKTCMKLLHDQKAIEGLQELINKCANKEKTPTKHITVRKIGKHKTRIGRKMRLTTKIGEYKMD